MAATKNRKPIADEPVNEKWLKAIGGKHQKFGGAYSFFGEDDALRVLIMVEVSRDGKATLSLIGKGSTPQLHYWLGPRSRADILALLRILGAKFKE